MEPLIVGDLSIPRYGFITCEEDDIVTELLEGEESPLVKAAQAADTIALAEGITLLEAYKLVGDAIEGAELDDTRQAIRLKHAALIRETGKLLAQSGQARITASVTAILRERAGLPGIPPRWPRRHRDAVWQLFQEEESTERMPAVPITEDLLGKPLPADGNPTAADGETASGS